MKKLVLHIVLIAFAVSVFAPVSVGAAYDDPANEQQIYDYLREDMQLNHAVSSAILANIERESRFDPEAIFHDVNGSISYGICQWNGKRFEALQAFCKENELDYTTLEGQLPFLQYELENDERDAYEKIRYAPDTVDGTYIAAYNWAKYFERCLQYWDGVDQFDMRGLLAEQYYWERSETEPAVTVRFDADGGSCLRRVKRLHEDTPIGRLPIPSKEGYLFVGWFLEEEAITETCVLTENATLTARWVKDPNAPRETHDRFKDVYVDEYYYDPICWAVEAGITSGTGEESFSPDKACTRAQIVTFLWRAAGSPAVSNVINHFADVSEEDYYYTAVHWAAEQGITAGTSPTSFSPDSLCTRAQAAMFLWNAAGRPEIEGAVVPFGDVVPGAYYYDAVCWAVEEGITVGVGNQLFGSENSCNRGQIVTFLYRLFA